MKKILMAIGVVYSMLLGVGAFMWYKDAVDELSTFGKERR